LLSSLIFSPFFTQRSFAIVGFSPDYCIGFSHD
jgi:hypothetical protein